MISTALEKAALLDEIQAWSEKYEFSFQFWGKGRNQLWIYKGGVELTLFGGRDTAVEVIKEGLEYIYKINRTPMNKRFLNQIAR